MFRLTRTQVQPIGLDIGHDSIRMLQLERVGESLAVVASARQPLGAEARGAAWMPAAVEAIRRMLGQRGFRGREVAACLPREMMHVKNLRLPLMPADELAAAVRKEAHQFLPFDPAEGCIHFLPAGEVRQKGESLQEVILLAARNEEIANHLEHLHAAGVVVRSLDCEASAVYRGIERFMRRSADEQEVQVLVEVGLTRTLVVAGRGGEICFIKAIDIAGAQFNEAVSRKLNITIEEAQSLRRRLADAAFSESEEAGEENETQGGSAGGRRDPVRQAAADATRGLIEELAREISLCLRYFAVTFRGKRPTRLRLVGGEAGDTQLKAVLREAMAIPVTVGRPLASIDTSRMKSADRQGAMCEWATALGLSMRYLNVRFGPRDGRRRETLHERPGAREEAEAEKPVDEVTAEPGAATGTEPASGQATVEAGEMEGVHA